MATACQRPPRAACHRPPSAPPTRLCTKFSRQARFDTRLAVYTTPGPGAYDSSHWRLDGPRANAFMALAEVHRAIEPSLATGPGPGAYTVNSQGPRTPRAPRASMHLSRAPPPESDTRPLPAPRSSFASTPQSSWNHSPRFRRTFLAPASQPSAADTIAAVHSPQSTEFRARRRRLWASILLTIEVHTRFFLIACQYRICHRLVLCLERRRQAVHAALLRWHRATVLHTRHVTQHIIHRLLWPRLLQARGTLRLRAATTLRSFLTWATSRPAFLKALRRFIDRVRRVQMWWRTLYRSVQGHLELLHLQWHAREVHLRRTAVAQRKAAPFLPFHVLWHVSPTTTRKHFTLTSQGHLYGRVDAADDGFFLSCTPTAAELLPRPHGRPFLVVYLEQDKTRCLVLTSDATSELHLWLNKLLLSIELRLALATEVDVTSLRCQLRLKALRDKRQLRTCAYSSDLMFCVGDLLGDRPWCDPALVHDALLHVHRRRRQEHLKQMTKYRLGQWKLAQKQHNIHLRKRALQHQASSFGLRAVPRPRLRLLLPQCELDSLIEQAIVQTLTGGTAPLATLCYLPPPPPEPSTVPLLPLL
ncbi:hypothetical protein SDRG_13589 [Saprolegnia diclina VS20]|uniref:Uncharacterized protein n=1 Tax=Saprolegnia diclina (strain VS20) TaxID=1156394 RepID=T0Q2C0_SAPDV|nr:hypothetical protein SDRG_13589 [Saprolegnia diclina VS20]EQC28716.1 hypothetical protein SDRG_13589 [Saprolegnia diclina VS20]|eukprot:XP_008617908.1 hypothetical protein SDRG_13589 [Saprolegnia diclina VS20]